MSPSEITAIAEVLRAVAWPGVAVVAAIFFRKEVAELARRLRKGGGAEFDPPQQVASTPNTLLPAAGGGSADLAISKTTSDALGALPKTPATERWETTIASWDVLKNAQHPSEREQLLLRLAARAIVVNGFERADGYIWRSQLLFLSHLSGRSSVTADYARTQFYEPAAKQFPSWYENYSFEAWLGFLLRAGFISVENASVAITADGREYLTWRIQQARPDKAAG